jgi:translation initiation factor IF-3
VQTIDKEPRVNERIRVSEVRVVDSEGTLIGVLATHEALALARQQNLDLVEVAPMSRPPVCRVMDYGRFKYEQSKRTRKARRKQQTTHLKEVRVRPKIDDHDYSFKIRNARKFLEDRDKVKVTVMFRGREHAYRDRGELLLKRIEEDLSDVAVVEVRPRMEGRTMMQVLSPRPGVGVKKKEESRDGAPAGKEPTAVSAGQEAPAPSERSSD